MKESNGTMEKEERKEKEMEQDDVKDVPKKKPLEDDGREGLDKLILDAAVNKYDLIILARRWAYELKAKEGETRSLQELIPDSIRDILTAKINPNTIRELPQLKLLAKKLKWPNAGLLENIGKPSPDSENDSSTESNPKKK